MEQASNICPLHIVDEFFCRQHHDPEHPQYDPRTQGRDAADIVWPDVTPKEHAIIWPLPGDGEETEVRLFATDQEAVDWAGENCPRGGWQYARVVYVPAPLTGQALHDSYLEP